MKIKLRNRKRNIENRRNKVMTDIHHGPPGSSGPRQYPCPSHVNPLPFISVRLRGKINFVAWQEQMTCFLVIQNMLGFVDRTIQEPGWSGARYKEWRMSDTLVKGWIFGSLTEDVMKTVVGIQTAFDVWDKLNTFYSPTPPQSLAPPPPLPTSEIVMADNSRDYLPLYRAIELGDWEKAQDILDGHGDALIDKMDYHGINALHIAVVWCDNFKFIDNLLDHINPELLPALLDAENNDLLHNVAVCGNTEAAKKLVAKNPGLLFIMNESDQLPILAAISNSQKDTFLYLHQACKQYITLSDKHGCYSPFEGKQGVDILHWAMQWGLLEVTYDLLKTCPELATTIFENRLPLSSIPNLMEAYPSAKQYNFYERFVYDYMPATDYSEETYKFPDIENHGAERANHFTQCTKSYVYPVPHIKTLHANKVKHRLALLILKLLCEGVNKLETGHLTHYNGAFIAAVCNDTPEVIEQLIQAYPLSVLASRPSDRYASSQIAIRERSEKVFDFLVNKANVVVQKSDVDKDGNNLLHLVGKLAPANKLNMVTGAALQMQREMQWFMEISKYIPQTFKEANNLNGQTPIMLFRAQHEELRQKGEEWLRKTADSYTIVAALIITIVFAAAITVPGGNKDNGKAIYERKSSFIIFLISDAISLFTSSTSLLLFLSILTARFAEEDFLYKLPKRLILGLIMLIMSVTTMLIAFGATLYLTLGQENSWILIPIVAITCLPIASFVTLQLPLLADLIYSTYSHRILSKKK